MTTAPALRTLISQVTDHRPDAEYEFGEPDGLGRVREVTFDKDTSKWLQPILQAANDPRIGSLDTNGAKGKQKLTVTLVADVRADRAHPFPVDEADEVLSEEPEESAE
jgi:hypothetical protein